VCRLKLNVLPYSFPDREYANPIFIGSDNNVELAWDDLLEKAGSGEEIKRRKKTERGNSTTNAFQP